MRHAGSGARFPIVLAQAMGASMCFVKGSAVATPGGSRPVEDFTPGDLLLTVEGGAEPVLWCGLSRISWAEQMADLRKRPVRIGKDALGPGVPERAVLISPDHRLLVRSPQVSRLSGQPEALVPALALTGLPGVRLMPALPGLDYVHLACARHSLLLVEGAGVESLVPELPALQAMSPAQRIDLAERLGGTDGQDTGMDRVRPVLSMRKAETLVERSLRSRMPLVVPRRDEGLAAQSAGRAG